MLTNKEIKLIKSLQQKKYRNLHGLFVAEGIKMVKELLGSRLEAHKVFVTDRSVFNEDADTAEKVSDSVNLITDVELRKISGLKTPNTALGVFRIPKMIPPVLSDWTLALDDVRDPGNLGAIIRLCDWFGISNLVCSENTVDCYNPKVLQATMGSIARVNIGYTSLPKFLAKSEIPVFGAFMDGETVYDKKLPGKGILVMGNEANGISTEVKEEVSEKIKIPQFGTLTTESLNVATAAAILLNEVRRDN